MFDVFDEDRNGFIDLNELLLGLQGELNDRRKQFIQQAFRSLDTDGSGVISLDEIMRVYDFTQSPDVRAGKKTVQEAAKEFAAHWETNTASVDGDVTYEEFERYYRGVSASIDRDDYFELMMRNAWRIAEGDGWCANTANRRVLVTDEKGNQSVQTVNNELGLRQGDTEGLRERLAQQGVRGGQIETSGGVDTRPKGSTFKPPARPTAVANSTTASGALAYDTFDPVQTLRKLLYDPPCALEQLANKLVRFNMYIISLTNFMLSKYTPYMLCL